jgi:WhiB family redox-sensing transcriptional regulator
MSSAIAFTAGEAITQGFADGVGDLLDAIAAPEAVLPCRSGDADLWFAESPAELERAKASCADCPVREACLAGALARREPWGVWGGEIFERGAVIARKRPRGRPRKNATVEPVAAKSGDHRSAAA